MEEQVITVNLPFTFVVGEMGEQIAQNRCYTLARFI